MNNILDIQLNENSKSNKVRIAQDVIYDAFEEPVKARRVALAKKALGIYEDCADAYMLLAHAAKTPQKALDHQLKGLEAATRTLPNNFKKMHGDFWGFFETRPYMRAKLNIAKLLYQTGDIDGAIEHFQEMLQLNPNDNQGVRYILLMYLYRTNRDTEFELLLNAYAENWLCHWFYHEALWLFRKHGDTQKTQKVLFRALKKNIYVPEFLLGQKNVAKKEEDYISPGDACEASSYVRDAKIDWETTPGSLSWMKSLFYKYSEKQNS